MGELKTQGDPCQTHPLKGMNRMNPAGMSSVGATAGKDKTPTWTRGTTPLKPRPTGQINSTSDHQDPAMPINGPSYPRDNSAIPSQSPYRQGGLRPRCWIRTS